VAPAEFHRRQWPAQAPDDRGTRGAARPFPKEVSIMVIDLGNTGFWAAVLALLMGILILVFPRILNYLVAIYLIIVGILGLIPFLTDAA
jgi:hypothetical protein